MKWLVDLRYHIEIEADSYADAVEGARAKLEFEDLVQVEVRRIDK